MRSPTKVLLVILLAVVSLVIGVYGAVAMTEAGQLLNMPREWVFSFFRYRVPISFGLAGVLLIVLFLNYRYRIVNRHLAGLYLLGVIGCLFFINFFASDVWLRAQHHTAQFISVEEADALLADDDDVFVLEINSEARAYPRDWMMLPHIAGDNVGGEEVAMTYCALSNLPLAFSSRIDGKSADYKVIAQVHNNLIFTDRNSGELIQQITGVAEYSQTQLDQFPAQRMPWRSFRSLYPQGRVFHTEPNWLDRLTLMLFDDALPEHYQGKLIFPTLRLDDDRLPNEEQIWGLNLGGEQLAIARSFFDRSQLLNTELGGWKIVIAWFPEFETLGVFLRERHGEVFKVTDIDPYGNTPEGPLERLPLYSGVLWMIWSHWFPDTTLLS